MAPITSARGRWHRRRLRLFGIGSPKSGTHSLEAVFAEHYRSAHEPEALVLVDLLVAVADGRSGEDDLRRYLRSRERRLRLEVNCAGLNGLVVDQLVEVVPTARFVLTLRDPYDWLASMIDHSLRGDPGTRLPAACATCATRATGCTPARRRSWPTTASSPWTATCTRGPSATSGLWPSCPPTSSWSCARTSSASGWVTSPTSPVCSLESLDATRTHEYAAPERSGLLDQLDAAYVREQVLAHGTSLVERYFPERLPD